MPGAPHPALSSTRGGIRKASRHAATASSGRGAENAFPPPLRRKFPRGRALSRSSGVNGALGVRGVVSKAWRTSSPAAPLRWRDTRRRSERRHDDRREQTGSGWPRVETVPEGPPRTALAGRDLGERLLGGAAALSRLRGRPHAAQALGRRRRRGVTAANSRLARSAGLASFQPEDFRAGQTMIPVAARRARDHARPTDDRPRAG